MSSHAAAELLADVARAMSEVHRQGIVHRDLKPSNILLQADGLPKVTDFGIAKQSGQELTASGRLLGTPSYMSPEQASGRSREIGPPSDVYSLGAILYELLTGSPPFRAETIVETVMQVMLHDPAPPSRAGRSLPKDLVAIAMKCLRKSPRERYSDAAALADDLQRFLDGDSILARPQPLTTRAIRWTKRHRTSLLIALLALSLIASVTALALRQFAPNNSDQVAANSTTDGDASNDEQHEMSPAPETDADSDSHTDDLAIENASFETVQLAENEQRPAEEAAAPWEITVPPRTAATCGVAFGLIA